MKEQEQEYVLHFGADTSGLENKLKQASRIGEDFGHKLTMSLSRAVIGGKDLESTLRSLALSLSNLALNAAMKPMEQAMGGLFGSIFSGFTGFSSGGVLNNFSPIPFAQGGVISSPSLFPLGTNAMGLAGEAGPEAILPLARGQDGRLGVRTSQGGQTVNVTLNVTTADAASFRQSEGQLAATLNRVVNRGNRNL